VNATYNIKYQTFILGQKFDYTLNHMRVKQVFANTPDSGPGVSESNVKRLNRS